MKKLTSLLLSLVLMVSVLACGASAKTSTKVRIAGLKGPTTMGLVNLLSMEKDGTASLDYDLQLYGAADEIVPKLIKGELDMAAIPANLAATLYQKTNGGIQVMAVNTLGVLYVVEKGNTVHSFADLKGRTILSTGKGTTPEYVLRYLLKKNGLDPDKDVKIEYYSEASEVTAQMAAARKDAIAVLPQPYVTAAQMKDSGLRVVLDLTREWNRVCDTQLITGVTVVRTEYAKQNPNVIAAFLTDYQKSVKAANEDIDGTAALCEEVGVVAKAAIAKKALPKCNIVYRNGQEMKKDISAYLQVLYDASPAAVMLLANIGLAGILSLSVPVLNAIYPIAIILIVVEFLPGRFQRTSVWRLSILFTAIQSIPAALPFGPLSTLMNALPLSSLGFGWLLPALIGIGAGLLI